MPEPITLPSAIHIDFGDQSPRWYLPTFTETLALMRWRLLYFLPALAILILLLLSPFIHLLALQLLIWWKIILIAVALPISSAFNTAKHAIRLKKEPFCIHCGYNLTSLPDGHRCPECGFQIRLDIIDDYRRDPHWFIQRYKLRNSHPPVLVFHAGPNPSPKSTDGT